ncbi:MAG: PAS domain-containing protein [Vicinamibacterales bacterium]
MEGQYRGALRLLQRPLAELSRAHHGAGGRHGWAEGVHPDDFDRCLEIYQDNFRDRNIFEMEYRLKRHHGAYRWIFDRGVPFFDHDGAFAGYIGSCVDVTDRVEAQTALKLNLETQQKQLKGIIPICSFCKKIRDDKQSWQHLEKYISDHSEAMFSHGLCPACFEEQMKGVPPLSA